MERKQIEAAANRGDVDTLHSLTKDFPLLLKSLSLGSGDTLLHMACIGGHFDFVKQVLNLMPQFAMELNHQGLTPLHIASARGDVGIVEELLKVGPHLCLLQGYDDRIPLHSAVAKGRIEVIQVLLSDSYDSVTRLTARGETCFHVAVKNKQCRALKLLCQHVVSTDAEEILNHKDGQGNTILHLCASTKLYQGVSVLVDKNLGFKGRLEVNTLNKKGLTPLDALISEGGGDGEIEEMLVLAGATTTLVAPTHQPVPAEQAREHPKSAYQRLRTFFKYDRINESPSEARNTLVVMAVLFTTATYSAVLSLPGGLWQDDLFPFGEFNLPGPPGHRAGKAVMASHSPVSYCVFLFFNSLGLFLSLQMMLLLCTTIGLPLRFELRIAVFAIGATYVACLMAITPSSISLALVFVLVLVPLTVPVVTIVVRHLRRGRHHALPTTN